MQRKYCAVCIGDGASDSDIYLFHSARFCVGVHTVGARIARPSKSAQPNDGAPTRRATTSAPRQSLCKLFGTTLRSFPTPKHGRILHKHKTKIMHKNTPHQSRRGVFSSLCNLRHRFFFFAHRGAQLQSGKDYYPNRQYRFEQIQSFNELCADADNAHIPKQYIHTFSFTPLYQILTKHSVASQPTPRAQRMECFRPVMSRSATSVHP